MPAAGVVLAGGRSARMGTSKAWLAWEGSTLLGRTCAVLGAAVDGPVMVVRAPGQDLPDLLEDVELHDDAQEGLGPVQGLATGLRALEGRADVAFVCSTDLPFLQPSFVRRVVRALQARPDADALVPVAHDRLHPLAAAYRPDRLAEPAEASARAGQLRLRSFLEARTVLYLGDDDLLTDPELADADPQLLSVVNVNDPGEYARALAASRG